MEKKIANLTQLFTKYEIDGLIQYKDEAHDTFTKFLKDLSIENDIILQLYITYKFGATKGAQF